jgi:hypothetical protein
MLTVPNTAYITVYPVRNPEIYSGSPPNHPIQYNHMVSVGVEIDPLKAVEMVEYKPKLFKAVREGPYLHEQLKSPDIFLGLPQPRGIEMLAELVSPKDSPYPSYFPTVKLNPPYDNIRVLLCPKCFQILRGAGHGAPVVCLECGFPSDDIWKPVD